MRLRSIDESHALFAYRSNISDDCFGGVRSSRWPKARIPSGVIQHSPKTL